MLNQGGKNKFCSVFFNFSGDNFAVDIGINLELLISERKADAFSLCIYTADVNTFQHVQGLSENTNH